jgi:hypothetical protein
VKWLFLTFNNLLAYALGTFGFICSKSLNVCLASQSFTFDRHLMKVIPEMHRPH